MPIIFKIYYVLGSPTMLPYKNSTVFYSDLVVCSVSDDIRESSSLDLNKFISDELQPNEDFHRLFNDAIDSLYRELQRDLQNTNYGIHNLIKVGDEAALLLACLKLLL